MDWLEVSYQQSYRLSFIEWNAAFSLPIMHQMCTTVVAVFRAPSASPKKCSPPFWVSEANLLTLPKKKQGWDSSCKIVKTQE